MASVTGKQARSMAAVSPVATMPERTPSVVLPGYKSPKDPSRRLKVGAHGIPRQEIESIQRERLIDAFVQIVARDGYEAAGVKAVCVQAGVSFQAFYRLFGTQGAKGKEALFIEAYNAGVVILFAAARRSSLADENMKWPARVEAGLGAFLDALADNPLFAQFFTVEVHKAGYNVQSRVDEVFEAAFKLFGRSKVAADMKVPAEHLGPLIIGGIYTRIYFYIRTGRTSELPDLLPILTNYVLTAFTGTASKSASGTKRPAKSAAGKAKPRRSSARPK